MKKKLLILSLFMAFGLNACSLIKNEAPQEVQSTPELTPEPTPEPKTPNRILIVPKSLDQSYQSQIETDANIAAQELGIEVRFAGSNSADAAEQYQAIETEIAADFDAIAIAPDSQEVIEKVSSWANQTGKTIIDWDTTGNTGLANASVLPVDGNAMAEKLVDQMVSAMGTDIGEYAILIGNENDVAVKQWAQHAVDYAKSKYSNLTFDSEPQPTRSDETEAVKKTDDILYAFPDLKGLISFDFTSTVGAANAIKARELQDTVALVGVANQDEVSSALSDQSLDAGVTYNYENVGYILVALANHIADGNPIIDFSNDMPVQYTSAEDNKIYVNNFTELAK